MSEETILRRIDAMLKTEYVRDGKNKIIGCITTGFGSGETVARDTDGRILGHSNCKFGNTRDGRGRLVSQTTADVGLLFRR
jgi:hypothetical protein